MNKTQKAALFGLHLVVFLLLIPLIDLVDTRIDPVVLRVVGYPLAAVMLLPLLFFTRKRKAGVDMDERDRAIVRRACLIAAGVVTAGLLAVYGVFVFMSSPERKIAASTLQCVVFFAFVAFILALSGAVLIQYAVGGRDGQE